METSSPSSSRVTTRGTWRGAGTYFASQSRTLGHLSETTSWFVLAPLNLGCLIVSHLRMEAFSGTTTMRPDIVQVEIHQLYVNLGLKSTRKSKQRWARLQEARRPAPLLALWTCTPGWRPTSCPHCQAPSDCRSSQHSLDEARRRESMELRTSRPTTLEAGRI